MTGVIGGVHIQDDLLGRLLAVELDVLLEEEPVEAGDLPGGDAVFEAGEGRLAGQVLVVQFPSAEELEGRVGPEPGVVVGVLVAGDEGEEDVTGQVKTGHLW
jgi:hypothetical protein